MTGHSSSIEFTLKVEIFSYLILLVKKNHFLDVYRYFPGIYFREVNLFSSKNKVNIVKYVVVSWMPQDIYVSTSYMHVIEMLSCSFYVRYQVIFW